MSLFNKRAYSYEDMHCKAQENVNITRLIAALALRGVECFRVNNDKHCADVVAHDPTTGMNLNIQVKGNRRILVEDKYQNRNVWIATWDPERLAFFIYNHDDAMTAMRNTGRWMKKGQIGTSNGGFAVSLLALLTDEADGEWIDCS